MRSRHQVNIQNYKPILNNVINFIKELHLIKENKII